MLSERNENVVDLPLFFPTLSYSGRFRDDGKTLNALAIRRLTNILIDGYRPIDERVVRDQRHNIIFGSQLRSRITVTIHQIAYLFPFHVPLFQILASHVLIVVAA